jgi:hypothetical protein
MNKNVCVFGTSQDCHKVSEILIGEYSFDCFEFEDIINVDKNLYDCVITHVHHKDLNYFIKNEIQLFENCPSPVILLLDKYDDLMIKKMTNIHDIDFCLIYDFHCDTMKDLFNEVITMSLNEEYKRKKEEKKINVKKN